MTALNAASRSKPATAQWLALGALAAVVATAAVLIVLALAIAIWPDIALFKPLDSYARAALFTIIPAFAATGLLAWLAARRADPVRAFVRIAAVVLLLSFIPDYLLPVPDKTLLASTVAAFLHVIAAAAIVGVLVGGYRRLINRG
jgi:hypothetical protein